MTAQELATIVGVVVAAVASVTNLYLQLRDRGDRYVLRFGSLTPPYSPGQSLYVVNRSKHPILFVDYGFVFENGSLYSLPDHDTNDFDDDQKFYLLDVVEPGFQQQAGTTYQIACCAAYAISSTQRIPSLSFRHGTPWILRLKLRWLAFWGGTPAMHAKP